MTPLPLPLIRIVLLLSSVATFGLGLSALRGGEMAAQQVQLLTLATGAGLLLAAVLAPLRLPALAGALLVKLSYLAAWWASPGGEASTAAMEAVLVAALAPLSGMLAREAWREARWNGGQSLRLEG